MTTLGTFRLYIELGNDAMQGPSDLAEALRDIADKVEVRAEYPQKIMDVNGNTVGEWTVEPD
jgi:hypothetical protein